MALDIAGRPEDHLHPETKHGGRIHAFPSHETEGAPLLRRTDHLDVGSQQQPRGERYLVGDWTIR